MLQSEKSIFTEPMNTGTNYYTLGSEYVESPIVKWSEDSLIALPRNRNKYLIMPIDSRSTYPFPYETKKEISSQPNVSEIENLFIREYLEEIKKFYSKGNTILQPIAGTLFSFVGVNDNFIQEEFFGDGKRNLVSEIMEMVEECSLQDWDGNDAAPIDFHTLDLTKDFIFALPDELPIPEAAPEPDGSISLDWIWSKNRTLSLSIGKTDKLAYAWLDGTDQGYAVARFDGKNIPKRIIDSIRGFLS